MIICVYKILNKVNNKVYIGSSTNFKARKINHLSNLRSGSHVNKYLQNSYKKYGEDNFIFEIIEDISEEYNKSDMSDGLKLLLSSEQKWINYYESYNKRFGYNVLQNAGSTLGFKHSEETKEKFKKRSGENHYNFGKKLSEETKNKISKSHIGIDYSDRKMPKEMYEKIGKTRREKFANGEYDETRKFLSDINTGENHPRAKLTEEDVLNILTEYRNGNTTYKKLSDKYGTSESYIGFIIKGKNWSYMKDKYPKLYK